MTERMNLNMKDLEKVVGGNYFESRDLVNVLIYDNYSDAMCAIYDQAAYIVVDRYNDPNINLNAYNEEVAFEMMRILGFEGNLSKLGDANTYFLNGKSMTHQEVLGYIKKYGYND